MSVSVLPEKFGVKLVPTATNGESKGRSFTFIPEDLLKLNKTEIKCITLKQLRTKLPSTARFCFEEGEEVDDSMTLESYAKYSTESSEKPKDVQPNNPKSTHFVKVWYSIPATKPAEVQAEPTTPSVENIMNQLNAPQAASQANQSAIYNRGQLPQSSETKGKLNAQTMQETIQGVMGGDVSQMSFGDFQNTGLKNMTGVDWLKVQQNLSYLHGYYPSPDKKRFLPAPYPAFRTMRKTDKKPVYAPAKQTNDYENGTPGYGDPTQPPVVAAAPPTPAEDILDDRVLEREIPAYSKAGLQAKIDIQTYRSIKGMQHAISGFSQENTQIALGVAVPVVQMGLSLNKENSTAHASRETASDTTSTAVASWVIPVVELSFSSASTEIHPDCKKRLLALQEGGTCAMAQEFLRDYGTAFSTRILLGGKLLSMQNKSETSKETSTEHETRVRMAVNASIAGGTSSGSVQLKGSIGYSNETANQSSQVSAGSEERIQLAWTAFGGEPIFAQSPVAWLPSVANFNNWQIIEHVEVSSMIYAFDRFEGFRGTSSLLLALLSPTTLLKPATLPWFPAMYDALKGFDPAIGAIGYTFSSTDLSIPFRKSPFIVDPAEISREGTLNISHSEEEKKIRWTILKDVTSVQNYVSTRLRNTRNQNGVIPLSDHLLYLDVSERSFTVILEIKGAEMTTTFLPIKIEWTEEALKIIKESQDPQKRKLFNQTYGDRWMTGWSRQRITYVNFQFTFSRIRDMRIAISRLERVNFTTTRTMAQGLTWMRNLGARNGVSMNIVVSKSDSQSRGFATTVHEQIKGDARWNEVYTEITNLENSDPIPIKIESHSFLELLPLLHFPRQFDFSYNASDVDVGNSEKKRKRLINFFCEIAAQSNFGILRYKGVKRNELTEKIQAIRRLIKKAEYGMKGVGYAESEVNEINQLIMNAKLDMLIQFGACHWVRSNFVQELELLKKDFSGEKYSTSSSSSGECEPDRSIFGTDAVNAINALCKATTPTPRVSGDWNSAVQPQTETLLTATPPGGDYNYKLAYWGMESLNGPRQNCRWWPVSPPNSNDSRRWQEEPDVFTWKTNASMKIDTHNCFTFDWQLVTWWLSDNDFPFDTDVLWDLEMGDVKHTLGEMAYTGDELTAEIIFRSW
ncbi:uncharacterized protein I303_106979 [Kwoniella dejecticola CBS 10117]|uniref:MACPF domain-containing protein n=1 Tax=Kwoniella dejecticola CBS 10117 TaxID=1296121 RepID=A0A1A5ZYF2_9TREE|nr:uncharacterized protein I303_06380 [Kwoniella dejecticola CBS 10117]OBR82823.1 hypothetical protein I303_06380 [Kwoniella dejecticola CBS 10117]